MRVRPPRRVAVVGSPRTPSSTDGGDAPAAHPRHQLGQRRAVSRRGTRRPARRPAKYVAIQMFRCGRRARRRSRRCTSTSPTSRPSYRSKADRGGQRLDVAAVAVDEHQPRWPSCAADRPNSTSRSRSADGADRDGAGEALVLAAGAVADRRATSQFGFIPARRAAQQPHRRRRWRCGCRCPAAGAVHAVRWNPPG